MENLYLDRLKWMTQMKRDPVHWKIMKTKDAFIDKDDFDPDESFLTAAIKKRKFLLEHLLEDRQYFPDNNEDDDNDDNVSMPHGLNYY